MQRLSNTRQVSEASLADQGCAEKPDKTASDVGRKRKCDTDVNREKKGR